IICALHKGQSRAVRSRFDPSMLKLVRAGVLKPMGTSKGRELFPNSALWRHRRRAFSLAAPLPVARGRLTYGSRGRNMGSGEWLEEALVELCGRIETGLDLDGDLIRGLVSFCELAPPQDAADYLTVCNALILQNIIGLEAGQDIIQEYMKKRGFVDSAVKVAEIKASGFQAYAKPPADEGMVVAAKKQSRPSKDINATVIHGNQTENGSRGASKGNSSVPKKKKGGKIVTLAEAAKGSVVFQQGKPCSCQARRHKLVSNCLSCGKIICEQEGEGPCSFCGVLVLREGSTYAGLSDPGVPLSEAEAAAEAYAKRLVDYDRNSTARTKVIDDQSDYYEIEGNSWLSTEVYFFYVQTNSYSDLIEFDSSFVLQEKQLLQKKQKEIEEAAEARKRKVIVTFDLLGRKVGDAYFSNCHF
ncbi:hypothetical protein B296_00027718, partial [Ensete ventricosum]